MAAFVLVHGAWHGAWCFERLAAALAARGHLVAVPDLPGHGADSTPPGDVTLADYVARVGEALAAQPEPALLLGHSMGGMVITQAGEEHAARVRALIYLCAFLPRDGESLGSLARPTAVTPNLRPDREAGVVRFDPAGAREAFYGDCSDADVAFASARLCPQPVLPWTRAVALGARYAALPRHYVECTQDRAIPIEDQRRMQAATPCRVHTLHTSHSPFLSQPEALAVLLDAIARDPGRGPDAAT
jgi:pimeloyl-ACP methyl ester carboxylesterase